MSTTIIDLHTNTLSTGSKLSFTVPGAYTKSPRPALLFEVVMTARAPADDVQLLTFDDICSKLRSGRAAPELHVLAAECALRGNEHVALILIGLTGVKPRAAFGAFAELRETIEAALAHDWVGSDVVSTQVKTESKIVPGS